MTVQKQTYRIDHKVNNIWSEFRSYDERYTYEVVQSHYDKFRDDNPEVEFRLITIQEKVLLRIRQRSTYHPTHKQHSLSSKHTKKNIDQILGNVKSTKNPHEKTKYEWNFYINDQTCAIWDYYGTRWSAYGPKDLLMAIGLDVE